MVNLHIDPAFDDAERRRRLFGGDVLVYTHVPEVAAFAAYTREMITELFAPHDPLSIQTVYSPEELADLLIEFKPRWIHDPRSMDHVRAIARALGCEPAKIHADVPKLRTAFPQGGLSTGIAYAFQAHRDTWYAAPKAQLNWWMPVWPVAENNIMEFYPHGFGTQVENNSGDYDYYVANAWRGEHQGLQRGQGRPGAPGAGARDPGRRDAPDRGAAAGRDHAVLRRSAARLDPEHQRDHPLQHRLPHRARRRRARGRSAPRWRTSPAPARPCATSSA